MANPNFTRTEEDSVQTLVKLRGNPLNYVISLKARYLQASGRELGKGEAMQMLLNRIPKKVIEEAITDIIAEVKPRK